MGINEGKVETIARLLSITERLTYESGVRCCTRACHDMTECNVCLVVAETQYATPPPPPVMKYQLVVCLYCHGHALRASRGSFTIW